MIRKSLLEREIQIRYVSASSLRHTHTHLHTHIHKRTHSPMQVHPPTDAPTDLTHRHQTRPQKKLHCIQRPGQPVLHSQPPPPPAADPADYSLGREPSLWAPHDHP